MSTLTPTFSDVVPRLQIILLVNDSTSPGNEFGEFNDVSSSWLGRIVVKFAIRKTFIFKVNETVTLESPRIILSSFFGELFPNILSCFLSRSDYKVVKHGKCLCETILRTLRQEGDENSYGWS